MKTFKKFLSRLNYFKKKKQPVKPDRYDEDEDIQLLIEIAFS